MATATHSGRNCLKLETTSIGTRVQIIDGDVIDNKAKAILNRCPETKFMVDLIEKHLLDTYPKIFNGTLDKVECVPQMYDYGVMNENAKKAKKALAMQYGNEYEIKERIEELKDSKKFEDTKELGYLKELLFDKMPLACEEKVIHRFLDFFENDPGLFLHGFKPKEYLKRFRELTKEKRKEVSTLKLLDVEVCVLELLGIKGQEIEDWVTEKLNLIKIKHCQDGNNVSSKSVSSDSILESLQWTSSEFIPKERKQQIIKFKTTFPKFKKSMKKGKYEDEVDENGIKIEQKYTWSEIRCRLLESEFDVQTTFDDEYDIVFIHPNEKLILAGEVKQTMSKDGDSSKASGKNATKAAHQVRKCLKFIEKTFGSLLDKDWRFVQIVILYDNHGTYITDKCSECRPFILTNGTREEERQQMQELWKAVTGKEYTESPKQPNVSGMNDFKHLFARLIGFSGLSFIVQKIGNYHELMGTNPHDIFAEGLTAGWTRAAPLTFGTENSDIRLGDIIGRPADIYRLVFWNPDQRYLLERKHRFIIFCNDYGAGKFKF